MKPYTALSPLHAAVSYSMGCLVTVFVSSNLLYSGVSCEAATLPILQEIVEPEANSGRLWRARWSSSHTLHFPAGCSRSSGCTHAAIGLELDPGSCCLVRQPRCMVHVTIMCPAALRPYQALQQPGASSQPVRCMETTDVQPVRSLTIPPVL